MNFGVLGQAVVLFAATNIDDLLVLAVFFAQDAGHRGATRTIALGQYLGFLVILAVSVAAAFGATFLPDGAVPYLGLLPLALGVKAAVEAWRRRDDLDQENARRGPKILEVAVITFANGGDNIGAYVPVFATAGVGGMTEYAVVFLVLMAGWLAAGRFFATRAAVARALARWGHILLPVVLIGLGLLILVEGGAFGL
ncbi:cadmium resistance transporter [Amycolatopsis sp. NBC_01480]|uniref:cadmium resistance transporter n=1 Tax=Amycolatopsis sp. NBC_01480 TaxID=2903562 RepID=UPI002E29F549|nr:cadmium resistance transporter [Amycolatopsis sp. NBC_01480]